MTKDEFKQFIINTIEEGLTNYADDANIVGGVFFQATGGDRPGTANFTFPSRLHCAAALQAISSDFLRQEIDDSAMHQAMLAQMMEKGMAAIGAGAASAAAEEKAAVGEMAEGTAAAGVQNGHLILPESLGESGTTS